MAVFCVADVHVGNHGVFGGELVGGVNRRCRRVLEALKAAIALVPCDGVFAVAGDLFDRCDPSPPIIAETRKALAQLEHHQLTILAVGNHDRSTSDLGDHALAPLDPAWRVERAGAAIVTGDTGELQVLVAPVVSGVAVLDVVREALTHRERKRGLPTLLIMHAGIEDETTAKYLRGGGVDATELAAMCREAGVGFVFAGDWHERRRLLIDGVEIWQVGALAPTGFDNPGIDGYGSVLEWDGRSVTLHEIPGPRFITADSPEQLALVKQMAADRGHHIYARVRQAEDGQHTGAATEDTLVLPPIAAAPRVPAGAQAEEAVQSWIEQQPVPELRRAAASTIARECLGGVA
jgi:hypothetical protein